MNIELLIIEILKYWLPWAVGWFGYYLFLITEWVIFKYKVMIAYIFVAWMVWYVLSQLFSFFILDGLLKKFSWVQWNESKLLAIVSLSSWFFCKKFIKTAEKTEIVTPKIKIWK